MRAVKILFLSFTCEDINRVAMVTNIITQLQQSFSLLKFHSQNGLEV